MPVTFVPFKPLNLLGGSYNNGAASAILNLVPTTENGYNFFYGEGSARSATALDTAPRGGTSIRKNGTDYVYIGTTGRLYLEVGASAGTVTNVSQGGVGATPYSTSSTDWGWSFTQWGDGIIATNYVDAVQYKSDYTTTAAFADAFTSTLKPKGKFITVVKNQVFLAYTNEGGTAYPNRVRWGAVDNVLGMDSSPSTQSDYQDLLDNYGNITGMVGGEYALIFKERAIYKCTYVGAPLIYRFDLLAAGIGTIHPGSIVEFEGSVYFWGNDRAYVIGPGAETIDPVTDGVVPAVLAGHAYSANDGFKVTTTIEYDRTKPYLVHSTVDLAKGLIFWAFPNLNSAGQKDIVAFHPNTGSASLCEGVGSSGLDKIAWFIQGPNVASGTVGYVPSGGIGVLCVQLAGLTIHNMDTSGAQEFAPAICSGMLTAGLGKRAVITAVRPAIFQGDNTDGSDPTSLISVVEVNHNGLFGTENVFTASPSGNGWRCGKANGEFLVIKNEFSSGPHICLGWEVVFDELDSER